MLFLTHCSENLTWQMGKRAGKHILCHLKHNASCYYELLCMKLQWNFCTHFITLKLSVSGIYNYSIKIWKCKLELKFKESIRFFEA